MNQSRRAIDDTTLGYLSVDDHRAKIVEHQNGIDARIKEMKAKMPPGARLSSSQIRAIRQLLPVRLQRVSMWLFSFRILEWDPQVVAYI